MGPYHVDPVRRPVKSENIMDGITIAYCAASVAAGSIFQGLTGFGFAIVAMPLVSLFIPPAVALPVLTMLQILSSGQGVLRDWSDIDFRAALVTCVAGIPTIIFGFSFVTHVSAELMRVVVGVLVIGSAIFLSFGFSLCRPPARLELAGAGILSGFLQGALAMSGPPIVTLLLASSWSAARCRATLSFVFLLLGCAAVVLGLWQKIVTQESFVLSAFCLPGLLVGQVIGAHLFNRYGDRIYRNVSVTTVAATGLSVACKGVLSYW
jgi:uncharacterized protein